MNKYRDALDVLRRGRDLLVDELADAVNDRAEDLLESPFLLGELLENHGMKLQFLTLMMSQLEQLADEQPVESRCGEEAAFGASDAESLGTGGSRRRRRGRRRGGRKRNRTAGANHASDDVDR
jgi:hypothetical protein